MFDRSSRGRIVAAVVERMMAALAHRGPDAEGRAVAENDALGFRRLAVLDLSERGNQPHASADGTVLAVVNGEIYNHRVLRAELEREGCRFRSQGDAEVVPHLYARLGRKCVERLHGMFALAVVDRRRGRLLLARDRLGKKPLYYTETDGLLRFASEASALVGDRPVTPDCGALVRYLTFGYVPEDGSAFSGLRRLPPGSFLTADRDGVTVERYWSPPAAAPDESLSLRDWKAVVFETLVDATRARLEADVPLGMFLSGGIDSGLVLAAATHAAGAPLPTFTVGFDEQALDERTLAAATARRFGAANSSAVARPAAAEALAEIAARYDEPFGDASAYPTLLLARMTREHVTVALSGDGGDESFGGYRRHRALGLAVALARVLPGALRRAVAGLLGEAANGTGGRTAWGELKRFAAALGLPDEERNLYWSTYFRAPLRERFLHPDLLSAARDCDPEEEALARFRAEPGTLLKRALALDLSRYLPDDLLVKVDIASMSCGLEVRSPLLDHRLVELARTIPDRYLSRGARTKVLLREIARDHLPAAVVAAGKRGFGVPLAAWLRGPLREQAALLLDSPRFAARRILRPGAARELLDRHFGGREDWSAYLWLLLVLEAWFRRFVDRAQGAP